MNCTSSIRHYTRDKLIVRRITLIAKMTKKHKATVSRKKE